MAGTTGTHADEFARIAEKEHNVAIGQHDMFGPSAEFPNKSQVSNPTQSGGINRPLKGMGTSGPMYNQHKGAHGSRRKPMD
jgi:hypothetical protein